MIAAFTPLVVSSAGRVASDCTTLYKYLHSITVDERKMQYQLDCLADKQDFFHSVATSIMTIRGSRSVKSSCLFPWCHY